MTREEYIKILRAFTDWLEGIGPPIQYCPYPEKYPDRWFNWPVHPYMDDPPRINSVCRIKPQPIRSRQFYQEVIDPGRYLTGTVVWRPGECEPAPPTGCKWLGGWIDVPDTEAD